MQGVSETCGFFVDDLDGGRTWGMWGVIKLWSLNAIHPYEWV